MTPKLYIMQDSKTNTRSLSSKLELLEAMDKIARKSKMTKRDIDEIAHKVNRAVARELGFMNKKFNEGAKSNKSPQK